MSMNFTEKYTGTTFVFHSPFIHTPGFKDGDVGTLVRQRLAELGDDVDLEVEDLWLARNGDGIEVDIFGGEAFDSAGRPIIVEQAFTNWAPKVVR